MLTNSSKLSKIKFNKRNCNIKPNVIVKENHIYRNIAITVGMSSFLIEFVGDCLAKEPLTEDPELFLCYPYAWFLTRNAFHSTMRGILWPIAIPLISYDTYTGDRRLIREQIRNPNKD